MKYNCNICNYGTDNSGNWSKHLKSKKHTEKVTLVNKLKMNIAIDCHNIAITLPTNNVSKSYTCDYCQFNTSHYASLFKHRSRCSERKIAEKEAENDKRLVLQENTHLKQVIEMLRESLTHADTFISKNGRSLREILYNELKDNPALKSMDYKDFLSLIKPKKKLAKELVVNFKHDTLHEFLGKFILNKVKKKNLKDQSIFSTDTSRQTYYIKTYISEDISEWKIDKHGIIVHELLIKPLTTIVLKLMKNYIENFIVGDEERPEYIKVILQNRDEVLKFINYLEDGKLDAKLNKYLCPHLVIDYDRLNSLKETKKEIPSLEHDNKKEDK